MKNNNFQWRCVPSPPPVKKATLITESESGFIRVTSSSNKNLPELPEEIILNILHRLPNKTLAKLKCVSKQWKNLISSFIRANRWKPNPRMIGIFFQNQMSRFISQIRFSRTDQTENNNKNSKSQGEDYDLDVSIGCIGHRVILAASSNGFLLCYDTLPYYENYNSSRLPPWNLPIQYYVCNPTTRQWVELPKPRNRYRQVIVGFVCKNDNIDCDTVSYKVILIGIPVNDLSWKKQESMIRVETYCSRVGSWKTNKLRQDVGISIFPTELNSTAVELDGVLLWAESSLRIIAYDVAEKSSWLLRLPVIDRWPCHRLAAFDGVLHYALPTSSSISIWSLESDIRCRIESWVHKYKIDVSTLYQRYQHIFGVEIGDCVVRGICFHHTDPNVVYLFLHSRLVRCDVDRGEVEVLRDFDWPIRLSSDYRFFTYEIHDWPCVMRNDTSKGLRKSSRERVRSTRLKDYEL